LILQISKNSKSAKIQKLEVLFCFKTSKRNQAPKLDKSLLIFKI